MLFNYLLRQRGFLSALVQLGGLEPPTSCSTDRRSNQLSYNCILGRALKKGSRTGGKLGATPRFGKARRAATSATSPRRWGPPYPLFIALPGLGV
jgi:hypothetical protein